MLHQAQQVTVGELKILGCLVGAIVQREEMNLWICVESTTTGGRFVPFFVITPVRANEIDVVLSDNHGTNENDDFFIQIGDYREGHIRRNLQTYNYLKQFFPAIQDWHAA